MTQAQKIAAGMLAIKQAISDGVDFVEARADDLPTITGPALILIDDRGQGPEAWNADDLLRKAFAIQVVEDGFPFDGRIVADMARHGVFVLISCGATFRAWFTYLEKLGLLANTLAQGWADPREKLQ